MPILYNVSLTCTGVGSARVGTRLYLQPSSSCGGGVRGRGQGRGAGARALRVPHVRNGVVHRAARECVYGGGVLEGQGYVRMMSRCPHLPATTVVRSRRTIILSTPALMSVNRFPRRSARDNVKTARASLLPTRANAVTVRRRWRYIAL